MDHLNVLLKRIGIVWPTYGCKDTECTELVTSKIVKTKMRLLGKTGSRLLLTCCHPQMEVHLWWDVFCVWHG